MKNNQGFVSILSLLFIPIILTLLIGTVAKTEEIQIQKKLLQICLSEGLSYQTSVADHLNRLLSLNPKAEVLIIQKHHQQMLLAQAIATENVAAVAIIEARILKIEQKQRSLSLKQQKFLYTAKQTLAQQSFIAQNKISSAVHRLHPEEYIFNLHWKSTGTINGKIPVVPSNDPIAPIFSSTNTPEKDSLMNHSWRWEIMISKPWNQWLPLKWQVNKECLVGLTYNNYFQATILK